MTRSFKDETLYSDFHSGNRLQHVARMADVEINYARTKIIEMTVLHDLRRPEFAMYQNPLNPKHWELVARKMFDHYQQHATLQEAVASMESESIEVRYLSKPAFELMFIRSYSGFMHSMFIDLHTSQSDLNKLLFFKINHYLDVYERTQARKGSVNEEA